MAKYSIGDADALIERTKSARPTCSGCAHKHTEPTSNMGEWTLAADRTGWIKRCAVCTAAKSFPWADRLDSFRVLAFMNAPENVDRVFWCGELEKLLNIGQEEWDFMNKQINHWKDRALQAERKLPKPEDVAKLEKYADTWRNRALDAEKALAAARTTKAGKAARFEHLQRQIDDLNRRIG